jgi:GTPase SAR1 family protein
MVETEDITKTEIDVKVVLVGDSQTGKTEFMNYWGAQLPNKST